MEKSQVTGIERLSCVELEEVKFPEPATSKRDAETEARVLLTWLQRGQRWYNLNNEEDPYSITGRLLQLIPRIADDLLRSDIENELKKET